MGLEDGEAVIYSYVLCSATLDSVALRPRVGDLCHIGGCAHRAVGLHLVWSKSPLRA